jgi:hypothetical protein
MMGTGSGASQASAHSAGFSEIEVEKIGNLANIDTKN